MKALFFSPVLEGYEYTERQAIEWGIGFSFCDDEPQEQDLTNLTYIETVQEDIDVYFCYGTDSYLFCQA
jgi:hypothetical protein